MALELQFANFNNYANLDFLSAKTPEELRALIVKWRGQLRVVSLYFDGQNHIAWVQTNFPMKKTKIQGVK